MLQWAGKHMVKNEPKNPNDIEESTNRAVSQRRNGKDMPVHMFSVSRKRFFVMMSVSMLEIGRSVVMIGFLWHTSWMK
jgi:hypothetical protein